MKVEQVNELKLEVERMFGKRILSSADCIELSDHVLQKTSSRLSFNTLRRFFHLMKSEFSPSVNTLNILSKYCGYSSLDNFLLSKTYEAAKLKGQADVKLLKYLVLQFNNIEVKQNNDATYLAIVRQTINFLGFCPDIIDQFHREIAKTKNGQTFYFELYNNIDKLHSYYGDGLKYYLSEKRSKESQIFGHSMLCLRYWLVNDKVGVEAHYQEVIKYKLDDTIHPFISARYFAAQLYYASITGAEKKYIVAGAKAFYGLLKANKDLLVLLPCFHLYLVEALILTGENKEALYYIEEFLKTFNDRISSYVDEKIFISIPLYHSLALARLGDIGKAKQIFKNINPRDFYFLSRQFHSILYLLLKELLQKTTSDNSQLSFLVKETGFIMLSEDALQTVV